MSDEWTTVGKRERRPPRKLQDGQSRHLHACPRVYVAHTPTCHRLPVSCQRVSLPSLADPLSYLPIP